MTKIAFALSALTLLGLTACADFVGKGKAPSPCCSDRQEGLRFSFRDAYEGRLRPPFFIKLANQWGSRWLRGRLSRPSRLVSRTS